MKWRLILRALRNRDMQKKLLAMVGILIVFRGLSQIPVPFAEPKTLKQVLDNIINTSNTPQLVSFINVLSGGALANFSIMLVGMGPFITSQIIFQLLSKAFPKLESMQNDQGEMGRRKINQYTRIATVPLAIIQSIGIVFLVRQTASQFGGLGDVLATASLSRWLLMLATLACGSIIVMWLGELLTEQGIGNGVSLLIAVGITSSLPRIIGTLAGATVRKGNKLVVFGKTLPISSRYLLISSIILVASILLTIFVVYLNEAQRKVRVSFAKRVQGNRAYGDVQTILPIKLITAGVVPIIFALAFLSIPAFAGQLLKANHNPHWASFGTSLVNIFSTQNIATTFNPHQWQSYVYPVSYFLLVFMFTFFYTGVAFNAKEIAEGLQKNGGFVADIRPGKDTEKYLSGVVTRLTLFGAFALSLLAIIPVIVEIVLGTNQIALGGTSILILVSVAIETLRQIESKAMMLTYDDYSTIPGAETSSDKKVRFKPIKLFTRHS